MVPVYSSCPETKDEVFAWCDGDPSAEQCVRPKNSGGVGFRLAETSDDTGGDMDCPQESPGCILQFSRVRGFRGDFGHFRGNHVAWHLHNYQGDSPVIDAINSSKVLLSGSVLIRKLRRDDDCKFLSWMVLTQSVDSSNIAFYGPSEVSAFCTDSDTALIVLQVHAIWADVYGHRQMSMIRVGS